MGEPIPSNANAIPPIVPCTMPMMSVTLHGVFQEESSNNNNNSYGKKNKGV